MNPSRHNTAVTTFPSVRGRAVRVFPNRYGILFALALLTMLIGSMNYHNNLGFLLTFLLAGMCIVSILHTHRNLSGIQVTACRARPVFAGEEVLFELRVRAAGAPRGLVAFAFGTGEESVIDRVAERDTVVRVSGGRGRRGIHRPGPLTVSTVYPLGLVRAWVRIEPDAACLVYPKPVPAALESGSGSYADSDEGKEGGPGVDDFQGLRSYRPGDSPQHISWKVFSRGQGLFTSQQTIF